MRCSTLLNILHVSMRTTPGIVPITCEELFKGIEEKRGTPAEYQVVLNMLEIYNEQVRIITMRRRMNMCIVGIVWMDVCT